MKWALEKNGVLQERRFDGPVEAAKWAAMMWPELPEATLADDHENDTPGWLVVPIQPE